MENSMTHGTFKSSVQEHEESIKYHSSLLTTQRLVLFPIGKKKKSGESANDI